jgi:hypothetical protein
MINVAQTYKALLLVPPVVQTSTTTGSAVDVETYTDDAMAIVSVGTISGGSPSTVVTITGSLTATPTVYDQTLATFVAFTAGGVGAGKVNLHGIKNVKGVATQTGAGNVPISISLVANSSSDSATLNSLTIA